MTIYYRAGWKDLIPEVDESLSNTPDWFDPLLIQAVRAYFFGIQTDTMDEQLGRLKASALFADMQRRDGTIQRRYGHIRGSGVRHAYSAFGNVASPITYTFP